MIMTMELIMMINDNDNNNISFIIISSGVGGFETPASILRTSDSWTLAVIQYRTLRIDSRKQTRF